MMESNQQNHNGESMEKEKNKKEILFEDLDNTSVNVYPFVFFCGLYLFNATLLLPISIIIMIYEFILEFFRSIFLCRFKETIKMAVFYPLDILMALSVLIMYPLAIIPTNKHYGVNFQYWAISTLIFLQSYILL